MSNWLLANVHLQLVDGPLLQFHDVRIRNEHDEWAWQHGQFTYFVRSLPDDVVVRSVDNTVMFMKPISADMVDFRNGSLTQLQ